MNQKYALAFKVVSALAALVMLNEYLLRFLLPCGVLDWIAEPGIIELQNRSFGRWWFVHVVFAVSAATVILRGIRIISDAFVLVRPANPGLYIGMSLVCAWSGLLINLLGGDSVSGGLTARYYWLAIALLWSLSLGLYFMHQRDAQRRVWRDWLFYSHAFALGTPAGLLLLPLFPLLLGFNPTESWISALTAGPAVTLLVAHALIFEVLERRRSP